MRQWRVGTTSMGVALIGLGIVLFLTTLNDWNMSVISLAWLPIIMVILGLEIIAYLVLSKKEQPIVKYDILSILFISVLGVMAICLFVLSSSGLLKQFTQLVQAKESQTALPKVEEVVGKDIKQVVIKSDEGDDVTVEGNNSDQLDIFGTYESTTMDDPIKKEDYVSISKSGDTLYVQVLKAPEQEWIDDGWSRYQVTVSVPVILGVEVRSYVNQVHIPVNVVQGDWYIESAQQVIASGWEEPKASLVAFASDLEELTSVDWDKNAEVPPNEEWGRPSDVLSLQKNVDKTSTEISIVQTERLIVKE
ncbi:hypothetical protein [Radiobacillus deserti]|uniref:Uncharacterized protein n=1 Tax=Radiobacillus deserti TaxID=2594883 RepID=A0A516KD47_9BACI|nr:hypothetical protein [Radiobacillus deserti]QDP39334.1 hypothetical protein FN924_03480 [Radiobacillus deserti]